MLSDMYPEYAAYYDNHPDWGPGTWAVISGPDMHGKPCTTVIRACEWPGAVPNPDREEMAREFWARMGFRYAGGGL